MIASPLYLKLLEHDTIVLLQEENTILIPLGVSPERWMSSRHLVPFCIHRTKNLKLHATTYVVRHADRYCSTLCSNTLCIWSILSDLELRTNNLIP